MVSREKRRLGLGTGAGIGPETGLGRPGPREVFLPACKKGDRSNFRAAHYGPFRRMGPAPFSAPHRLAT